MQYLSRCTQPLVMLLYSRLCCCENKSEGTEDGFVLSPLDYGSLLSGPGSLCTPGSLLDIQVKHAPKPVAISSFPKLRTTY
jgi:hypothetical protein